MQRLTRAARMRALLCLFAAACALPSQASAQAAGRERVSFNQGWRFRKDDGPGAEGRLAYERIKDWVRATGGEFVAGGAGAARPEGEPGGEVAYTRRDFDDRGWRAPDATSFEPFRSKQRNAYNGLCLVVVRAKAPGRITQRAHAEGLKGALAVIRGTRGR